MGQPNTFCLWLNFTLYGSLSEPNRSLFYVYDKQISFMAPTETRLVKSEALYDNKKTTTLTENLLRALKKLISNNKSREGVHAHNVKTVDPPTKLWRSLGRCTTCWKKILNCEMPPQNKWNSAGGVVRSFIWNSRQFKGFYPAVNSDSLKWWLTESNHQQQQPGRGKVQQFKETIVAV